MAKRRLAEEYDAAKEAGEVQSAGGNRTSIIPEQNNALAAKDIDPDLPKLALSGGDKSKSDGAVISAPVSPKLTREARIIRDAKIAEFKTLSFASPRVACRPTIDEWRLWSRKRGFRP